MRLGAVITALGWLIIFISSFILLPVPVSFIYEDGNWVSFLCSSLVGFLLGGSAISLCKPEKEIGHREGFVIVSMSWLLASAIGSLPYYLSGAIPSFLDAFFEAMSGFTTTGASILAEVEPLGESLLFWRSLTHWLGGMGIIVLSVAILPFLGIGGMQLVQAEMAGPVKDRLAPRMQDTARILWTVYVVMTGTLVILLLCVGIDFYRAINHAMATIATGGFSTMTASVAGFNNLWVEIILIVFMLASGVNFTLYYRLYKRKWRDFFQDEELRFYLAIVFTVMLLVTLINFFKGSYETFAESLRGSTFAVASIATTTGFATDDFDKWDTASKFLLMVVMLFGGMAGSTSGGLKQVRTLLFLKFSMMQIKKYIHPRSVETLKINGARLSSEIIQGVLGFLSMYMAFFFIATLLISIQGGDLVTNTTAVITTLNGCGPGLVDVGPSKNFAHLSNISKMVLIICMLAGRLELYTLVILTVPGLWKGVHGPVFCWQKKEER